MNQSIALKVPDELKDSLFFPNEVIVLKQNDFKEWNGSDEFEVFSYELLFYSGNNPYLPWSNRGKYIPELLVKWKMIKTDCDLLFSERNAGQAMEPMKQGIGLLLSAICWLHGKPVTLRTWKEQMKECTIKPVNLVERLSFVMENPAFFLSFRQLSELFLEFEKRFVISKVQK